MLPAAYSVAPRTRRKTAARRQLFEEGAMWGSNPRQPEPQSGALPTELIAPCSERTANVEIFFEFPNIPQSNRSDVLLFSIKRFYRLNWFWILFPPRLYHRNSFIGFLVLALGSRLFNFLAFLRDIGLITLRPYRSVTTLLSARHLTALSVIMPRAAILL